jgi:hypothetical protein
MTYLFFLMVLLIAGGIVAVLRIVGLRVKFGSTFKALAISLTMLPVLVMSAALVLILEIGLALVVWMILDVAGVDLSAIPHRYEVVGLGGLAVVALCVYAAPWFRYVLLIYREGK